MGILARAATVGVALGGLVLVAACGTEGGSEFEENPIGSSGSSGTSSSGTLQSGDASTTPPELVGCATDQKKADPLPLDLYVMLDTSGSMHTQVSAGVSKDKAVKDALDAFVTDPGSAGIGMGLQFFPVPTAGTPASCTDSSQCNGNGPCSMKVCAQPGPLVFCDSNSDCAPFQCISAGRCANAQNVYCTPGTACGPDVNGFDRGTCIAQAAGYCSTSDSCTATDYSTPAVPIAMLPGAGGAVSAALAAKQAYGNTPTSAALQGAVDAAKAYAEANPGHTVVAVLATDGFPTECDTDMNNVAAIAAAALAGTPSIKTYVIGVFSADEAALAQTNLDQIAVAGGTTTALIVTATASTTAQFVAAMNKIRGNALPCDYVLPKPASGEPDYDKMNVQHTDPGGKKTLLPNRSGAGACDASGGWYYDVSPTGGGIPTKVILCPTTCDAVKAAGGQVDVVIGCKTQVR